jgi:hypothetical protein
MYIEYTLIMYILETAKNTIIPLCEEKKIVCEKKGLSDYPTTSACILDEQTEKKIGN